MPWGKESRQARGYGAEWERLRKIVIARDMGLCQICKRAGRVTQGKDVDHIVSKAEAARRGWSKERTDDIANLEYVCVPCHKVKTEQEQGKTKNAPRPKIGLDGWPVE